MTGLDTSVLLRLLVGHPVEQSEKARSYLDDLFENGERVWVSDLVVSETYFALQHHYNATKREALGALRDLFEAGEIIGIGAAPEVLKTQELHSKNPGFVDRLIHTDYTRSDGTMVTFEKKAGKLERTRVL